MTKETPSFETENKQDSNSTFENISTSSQSSDSSNAIKDQALSSIESTKAVHLPTPNETNNKQGVATYSDKTNRLIAWSNIIKNASTFIWIIVIFIVLTGIWGKFEESKTIATARNHEEEVIITIPLKAQISDDLAKAMTSALVSAKSVAGEKMEDWKNQAMNRVDHPFLDWYYNYFTQWAIGLNAIWTNITSPSEEAKAEKIIGSFQKEFEKQVLQPSLMQLQMERYTREAIDTYIDSVSSSLSGIQGKYKIPQPDWERYLNGLGSITYENEGKSQDVNLALIATGRKAYVATSAMVGAIGVIGTQKIVTKTATKATSKAITKIATKTATKVAAEGAGELTIGLVGLELINPLAGLGILAWDIWDHYHTVKVERPILRSSLNSYLDEVKDSLLNNKKTGIMSSINQFHDQIMDRLSQV